METISQQLEKLRNQGLYRATRLIKGMQQATVEMDGKQVLLLCSNNYLGLADHPLMIEGTIRAVERFGTSSGASRLVSGTMELHEELERALATFKNSESALLFNSGHAANTGVIPALVGRGDLIFSDRLNHASIVDGALLSGARLIRYPHNDMLKLQKLLEQHRGGGRTLIVSDGVFSMDGDYADVGELVRLKQEYGALLMIDDAHGSGVLGETGRGTAELCGVADQVDIQMGTLGKAFGSFGAYVAVTAELRELLVNRARSFIFSTSLPPAVLGASLAALTIITSAEGKRLRQQLLRNAAYFRNGLTAAGFRIPAGSTQIVPIMVGPTETTMLFSQQLLEAGFFVQGIRPPTVPAGSSRLRCTVMATHSEQQLDLALKCLVATGQRLGVLPCRG